MKFFVPQSTPELHPRILPYPPLPMQFPASKLFLALIISPCIIIKTHGMHLLSNTKFIGTECDSFIKMSEYFDQILNLLEFRSQIDESMTNINVGSGFHNNLRIPVECLGT